LIEEDDIVIRVGSSLRTERRQTDKEGKAASLRDIRSVRIKREVLTKL
jgi:hypothetical protein